MPRIFISYRRNDNAHFADRLKDVLSQKYGEEQIFIDIGKIPLGFDFREYIRDEILKSDVVLVLIGTKWLEILQDRIDQENDYLRIEIEQALANDVLTIPVLFDDAKIPDEGELPESTRQLHFLQAIEIRRNEFDKGVETLINGVEESIDIYNTGKETISLLTVYEAWNELKILNEDKYRDAYSAGKLHGMAQKMDSCQIYHVEENKDNIVIFVYVNTSQDLTFLKDRIRHEWINREMSRSLGKKVIVDLMIAF
ncbi:MAG: toll/interleukin-1 receptor domain-containing protein [Anaerolineae bacterium]